VSRIRWIRGSFSSLGPARDGRIKPDIVANGHDVYSASSSGDSAYATKGGTSMATPNAAGSAALLIERARLAGRTLRASSLKGLIIHTADDLGTAGPDYKHGWGLINAQAAADLIDSAATDYSALPHTPHPFGFYLFTGVAGRAVGRNIFLDGNTFNDSLRADKEWFVGDWSWGFAFHAFRHLEFSYTRVRRTHEFKTQQGMDTFGSLNLRLVFDF
jgi:subtilisin family serine protease